MATQKHLILAGLLTPLLFACASPTLNESVTTSTEKSVSKTELVKAELPTDNDASIRGTRANADVRAQEQSAPRTLRRATTGWIGNTMVPVNADDKLPELFHRQYNMNFADGNFPVDLSTVAARLTEMVGIPVRVQGDVYEAVNAATPSVEALPAVAAGQPVPPTALATLPGTLPAAISGPAGVASTTAPMSTNSIRMKWQGTLTDFLNNLTDRLGLSWEYRNNTILIMRFVTEMYELAAFPNGFSYDINSGGAGGTAGSGGGSLGGSNIGSASSGGSNSGSGNSNRAGLSSLGTIKVTEKGEIDGAKSIISLVESIVAEAPGSKVVVSEGTGRIMVRTSKDLQAQVREVIRAENVNLTKQVHIQLDLYSVQNTKDDQRGVDWGLFYQNLAQKYNFRFSSPVSAVGTDVGAVSFKVCDPVEVVQGLSAAAAAQVGQAGITPTQQDCGIGGFNNLNSRLGGTNPIIQSLYKIGDNVQHRPISLVAMNRQWSRKARLNTTGYLAETTPASTGALGGGSAVPGLETDSITTGDQFAVMPYVLDNNTILVKMGISLSDLLSLLSVTTGQGATQQQVQTPNTSAITDQYTVALKPGEVMAITGLTRDVSIRDRRTLHEGLAPEAGGSQALQTRRESFIVFLRAVVL